MVVAFAVAPAFGQTINIANVSDFNNAMTTIDANPGNTYTLNLTGGFSLNQAVSFSNMQVTTLQGNTFNIDGAGTYQPFVINAGVVSVQNLSVSNLAPPITINAGVLMGSTDILQGAITNNGSVNFTQATSGTYYVVITGSGTVEVNGAPVTFTGLNNYTGGTTVDAASQLIGTTDSLQGDITTNGLLQFSQSTNGTYSGNLSGSGAVQISGTGQVTFSGTNSYQGGTTVDNVSTLIGTTDNIQGAITNSGAIQFNQLTTGTYAGNMIGNGSVEISGGGTVTFSGTNSYSGGTTVDNTNTLIGTTDSLQGGITNNGAIQFNQATNGSYTGSMTGSGSVEISGTGQVTFSGSNSYGGGTTIDLGSTLIGTTDSLQGIISNSGALQFNQATTGTFGGSITGSGSVEVGGSGTVTFSSANSYSGGTTVDTATTLIGTTDSLQGAFTNNGAVQFNQAIAGTYGGNMTGSGSVEISGIGPVTFSGTNSYSGGTTVDLGSTLIGTTDSLQGAFTNNGAVQFNQGTAGTYGGNMIGTGSVEISGTGPVTFSGSNSYSGGTTVDLGSALIGSTSSIQGAITNNGAVQFNQISNGSYSGNMSGSGSVEISSTGTVTFSGQNSYTGGTTIDLGSKLSGTTDSIQGDIVDNGALIFLQNTNGTYAGNISGTGSVEVVTAGTTRFTGLNSYSGGTTVDGGAILIGTTDSLQGNFNNSGQVIFNQATSGTYSGNMSGAGSVEINSSGVPITFSGTNSYVGGTTIVTGSTLIGTTNSLQGDFSNGGSLIFNQAASGTFGGNIAGTGNVEISGIGPITFSGTNTYSGGTTVDNGSTLIGTTSSLQGAIIDQGSLQFNQSTTGTFASAISGNGSVFVTGGGNVTFSGNNSYVGGTTIDLNTTLVGTTSSLTGSFVDNGALKFNQNTSGVFGGNISGSGSVEISGTGPITFTGTNSYTGGTTIDSGSKLIGNTTSLYGGFSNGGTLQFNQSTAGVFNGGISGSGSVEISGAGPVTFVYGNTYSGGTTIDSGSTLIGNAGSLQQGFTNNGSLIFNQAVAGIFTGNIAGSGSVEISGGGTITLLGTNSYTGGTTVDSGSGLIGTTSNLQGSIVNNGAIQFNQSTAGTYGGHMSGTGSVEVSGGNRITFSGTNTYTGGTTVDSGTTLIGSTFSLQGNFTNNGSVQFVDNVVVQDSLHSYTPFSLPYIYSGNMTGTGNVELSGSGPVTFSGTNSYTGGTTVDHGVTLTGGTLGIQGNITNNGWIVFNESPDVLAIPATGTYSGNMTGSGGVQISGSSAVTFSGTNNYTGGTTVDSTASLFGTTSSLQGAITNNGFVQFNQTTSGTYSGNMTGTGAVTIGGSGPVTFAGTNTYSGGTTINTGATLIGTTNSLQGLITDNGTVQFNQTTPGTFQSVISGTGGVFIGGVGPVTFSGNNTYTGGTTVGNGSTFVVNGSVVGTTNVNSGGTLSGGGTLGNTIINAGGTIYPNNSLLLVLATPLIATNATAETQSQSSVPGGGLTINGNFQQSTGSTYSAHLNPSWSDRINVSGVASISTGTNLNLVLDSGTYSVGSHFQILTAAGGLNGNYTSMTTSPLSQNIVFQQQYSANDLQLIVNSNISPLAQTPNQAAVASVIDQSSATATGDFANAITQLTTLSSGQLSNALNQLSGEIYSSIGAIERQTTTLELQLLSNRLAGLTGPGVPAVTSTQSNSGIRLVSKQAANPQSSNPTTSTPTPSQMSWTTWGQGYGLGGNVGGDGNAGGLNYRLAGTLFGAEKWLDEATMIGVLGGYAGTSIGDRQNGSSAQINSYQVGLYELRRMDSMYLSNVDAFGNDNYDTSRPINFGSVNTTASGKSSGNQWAHYTEAGTTMSFDDVKLQPFMGLQYMYLDQRGYTETGAGSLNLTTDNQIVNSLRQSFGARLSRETMWGSMLVIPTLAARYQHEFGNGTQLLTSSFSGAPTVQFATSGAQTGRNFGLFTLGATAYISDQFSIYGSVDTQIASQYTAIIGSGGLQYSW